MHYIIIINTQFIKTVCFESNMIHLQQCFTRYVIIFARHVIILYYIYIYLVYSLKLSAGKGCLMHFTIIALTYPTVIFFHPQSNTRCWLHQSWILSVMFDFTQGRATWGGEGCNTPQKSKKGGPTCGDV